MPYTLTFEDAIAAKPHDVALIKNAVQQLSIDTEGLPGVLNVRWGQPPKNIDADYMVWLHIDGLMFGPVFTVQQNQLTDSKRAGDLQQKFNIGMSKLFGANAKKLIDELKKTVEESTEVAA